MSRCNVSRWFSFVLNFLLPLSLVYASLQSAWADETAQFRLDKIKQDWDHKKQTVESLHVLFQSKSYPYPEYPKGFFLRIEMAARSDGCYFHDSSKGAEEIDWQTYRTRQVAYVSPSSIKNFYPFNRSYFERTLAPTDPLPGSHYNNFYFLATGVWPYKERSAPRDANGIPLMPHEILADTMKVELLPEQVTIEGRVCNVIKNGANELLYMDDKRASCIVQRDTLKPETQQLIQRFILLDQKEVLPGIWLPLTIVNQRFVAGNLEQESKFTVEHCVLNQDEPDSTFHFKGTAGLVKMNENNKYQFPTQVTAGGLDHLDDLVDWLGREPLAQS